MAKQTKTGVAAIRDIWAEAQRALDDSKDEIWFDPDPNEIRHGFKPGQWPGAPHDELPPKCPVQVIGRDGEQTIWCRTAMGDLYAIEKWDMATISALFSPCINYAFWAWPAFGKTKKTNKDTGEVTEVLEVKRVERDKLFTCLGNVASKMPLFDPNTQHRGRGGWLGAHDSFIWHSGRKLWTIRSGKLLTLEPQQMGEFLYTRQPSTIEPWEGTISQAESPANRILTDLRTWAFERPYIDPLFVLGWIATAFMGGALKARPIIFTTGGAGVGKSTLHEMIKHVLNRVVFSTVDTTAAGIYQRMKHDALPIMVDELENKPGSSKASNVIELARVSYTGGDIARGGSDHEGTTFKMHSSFFFSAINPPFMGVQDKTRMAVLNLSRLDASAGVGRKVVVKSDSDGRMILRQIMDGWDSFIREYLPRWWRILAEQGLDSRAIDTYGTLLAAAELLVGIEGMKECGLPVDEAEHLAEIISNATSPDRAEQLDNWHRCLNHLFASAIDQWRDGVKPTVGGVMEELSGPKVNTDGDTEHAKKRLELVNLSCRARGDVGTDQHAGPYLAIPSDGPQLARLFSGTEWERGVWNTALKQGVKSGVVVVDRNKAVMKINGAPKRCLLIDMAKFQEYAGEQ